DRQRDTFFTGQAASGFALGHIELLAHRGPGGFWAGVEWLRDWMAARIAAVLPGSAGAVTNSLLIGVTAGISPADWAAFRDSGLAHLLSVSGLHVSIVMGLVFGGSRRLLSFSEHACLFWPNKQIAAIAALLGGVAYLVS